VALIRTLAIKPDILLLDEPFSALDYQTRLTVADDVHKIIKEENKTVVMITHDIAEGISLSDRIIILSSRPSTVKDIVSLNFDKEKTPTQRRSDSKFSEYYEHIWKMIDIT
ncbi:MAG: spermidine/putrescine ABC transporter ATP-binding protein, partial [bacterium]